MSKSTIVVASKSKSSEKANANKSVATQTQQEQTNAAIADANASDAAKQEQTQTQTQTQSDDANKSVATQQATTQNAKRITIFSKSLTSVCKAMTLELDMTTQDVLSVCNRLASSAFAKASVTTACSDAKNAKYRKVVATLNDAERATIAATIKAIAEEAKQATTNASK